MIFIVCWPALPLAGPGWCYCSFTVQLIALLHGCCWGLTMQWQLLLCLLLLVDCSFFFFCNCCQLIVLIDFSKKWTCIQKISDFLVLLLSLTAAIAAVDCYTHKRNGERLAKKWFNGPAYCKTTITWKCSYWIWSQPYWALLCPYVMYCQM